jgi:hypothetical protein
MHREALLMCILNPQPIESRSFLARLPLLNWHRSSQTAVLLVEVEILVHLDGVPCRDHLSRQHLLWKWENSVSQWPLTQAFTSFCVLLNLPLNSNGSIMTAQYHCSIPAVRTTILLPNFSSIECVVLLISSGMSKFRETELSVMLTCYCIESIFFP